MSLREKLRHCCQYDVTPVNYMKWTFNAIVKKGWARQLLGDWLQTGWVGGLRVWVGGLRVWVGAKSLGGWAKSLGGG